MKRPPIRTTPVCLVLPAPPMSYQRYAQARHHAKRFKPADLRVYQEQVQARAYAQGFRADAFGRNIRARIFFFMKPMHYERERMGFSECQKDVDNLVKAVLDGLGIFFNDRHVVQVHAAKIYVQDRSLQGVLAKLDTALLHTVKQDLSDMFGSVEEARPWLKYIQTHECS